MGCQIMSTESRQVQSMISLHLLMSELQASANVIINLQLFQGHKKLSSSLEFLFSFLPFPYTHTDTQHIHVWAYTSVCREIEKVIKTCRFQLYFL